MNEEPRRSDERDIARTQRAHTVLRQMGEGGQADGGRCERSPGPVVDCSVFVVPGTACHVGLLTLDNKHVIWIRWHVTSSGDVTIHGTGVQ